MAKRRRGNRIQVRIEENVIEAINDVKVSLRGPSVAKALQEGATLIANAARSAAPQDTGQLRAGIYTASIVRNEFKPLVRTRGSTKQRLNSRLKFAPRPKQAVVVSSVFYTRFIEGGVGRREQDSERGQKHMRRGVGRQRRRPFFQQAVRKMRKPAELHVQLLIKKLIEGAWAR